jgi:hypothetical protein
VGVVDSRRVKVRTRLEETVVLPRVELRGVGAEDIERERGSLWTRATTSPCPAQHHYREKLSAALGVVNNVPDLASKAGLS